MRRSHTRLRVTSTTRNGDSRHPRGMSPTAQPTLKETIPAVTNRPITAPAAADGPAPPMSRPSPNPIIAPRGMVTARAFPRVRHFSASVTRVRYPLPGEPSVEGRVGGGVPDKHGHAADAARCPSRSRLGDPGIRYPRSLLSPQSPSPSSPSAPSAPSMTLSARAAWPPSSRPRRTRSAPVRRRRSPRPRRGGSVVPAVRPQACRSPLRRDDRRHGARQRPAAVHTNPGDFVRDRGLVVRPVLAPAP